MKTEIERRLPATVVMRELDSPVGVLVAGATDRGLCLLEFRDREILETQIAKVHARVGAIASGTHPLLDQLECELDEYFAGRRRTFSVPLVYPGTPFQSKVWNALRNIPFGTRFRMRSLRTASDRPLASASPGMRTDRTRSRSSFPATA